MINVLIRHKVADYDSWKKAFDDFAPFRKTSGELSYHVMQYDNDANNLYLLFKWDTIENARSFLGSAQLKEAMQSAGVTEPPEIQFLHDAAHGSL